VGVWGPKSAFTAAHFSPPLSPPPLFTSACPPQALEDEKRREERLVAVKKWREEQAAELAIKHAEDELAGIVGKKEVSLYSDDEDEELGIKKKKKKNKKSKGKKAWKDDWDVVDDDEEGAAVEEENKVEGPAPDVLASEAALSTAKVHSLTKEVRGVNANKHQGRTPQLTKKQKAKKQAALDKVERDLEDKPVAPSMTAEHMFVADYLSRLPPLPTDDGLKYAELAKRESASYKAWNKVKKNPLELAPWTKRAGDDVARRDAEQQARVRYEEAEEEEEEEGKLPYEFYEARLEEFYRMHKPEKLDMVPEIMARWEGKEDELLKAVVEKYKNQVMQEGEGEEQQEPGGRAEEERQQQEDEEVVAEVAEIALSPPAPPTAEDSLVREQQLDREAAAVVDGGTWSDDDVIEIAEESWACVACKKEFKSEGQFTNHCASKKHKEKMKAKLKFDRNANGK